jgi:hypothetical protein
MEQVDLSLAAEFDLGLLARGAVVDRGLDYFEAGHLVVEHNGEELESGMETRLMEVRQFLENLLVQVVAQKFVQA